MKIAALILTLLVAVEHVLILILEMFFWTKPLGMRIFNMTQEVADSSAVLAMNQGLYNGFLAAGLFWAVFFLKDFQMKRAVQLFFLGCVVVAGIFGGLTAKFSIIFTQGLPALLAFIAVFLTSEE